MNIPPLVTCANCHLPYYQTSAAHVCVEYRKGETMNTSKEHRAKDEISDDEYRQLGTEHEPAARGEGERFRISTHQSGYYCVSIPNYHGGEVVKVEEYERLRRMLSTVIDANYGTSFHHIGDGDGIPEAQANEIAEWWKSELERIQQEYNERKNR